MTINSDVTIFNLRIGADGEKSSMQQESWEFPGMEAKDR